MEKIDSGKVVFNLKRVEVQSLIEAAIAANQEPSFRLHLAGAGPTLPELQSLVLQLGINDRVQFLGRRDTQIKLRGQRIELEEIDTALAA